MKLVKESLNILSPKPEEDIRSEFRSEDLRTKLNANPGLKIIFISSSGGDRRPKYTIVMLEENTDKIVNAYNEYMMEPQTSFDVLKARSGFEIEMDETAGFYLDDEKIWGAWNHSNKMEFDAS